MVNNEVTNLNLFMSFALEQANKAKGLNEIPVGAVIVKNNKVLSYGFNQKESLNDPTFHAEIIAIKNAAQVLNSWRLDGCTMYVTFEPCPMCAGAIIQSRISKLVFGAYNLEWGACGTVFDIFSLFPLGKKIEIISGIMEQECQALLENMQFRRHVSQKI